MNDIRRCDSSTPLTIDEIRDLAIAISEDFGHSLLRAVFTDKLLHLLEDVSGFESGEVSSSMIDAAWAEYGVIAVR